MSRVILADAATATGAGPTVRMSGLGVKTFQASGSTTAGSGSATIEIQCSNSAAENEWITRMTLILTLGTTVTTDGAPLDEKWSYVRRNITAISGTGASVDVIGEGI